jgi:hypothetical protein
VVRRRGLLALVLLGIVGVLPADAQRRRRAPLPETDPDFKAFNVPYDGLLTFVRLRYTPSQYGWGGGGGFFGGVNYNWDHDYPRADRHVMTIVKELTAIDVREDGSNVLGAGDPELFKYPIAYMAEPGYWTLTDQEAATFRAYLEKGGFLIFDDFAGGRHLSNLEVMMRKVLPEGRIVQLEASHPIFHSFFEIDSLDYMHPYYGVPAYFLGIYEDNDPTKRLLVIVNYNNDVGESWEWSDRGFIPIDLSNTAFRLGVNYFMYALTH